MVVIAYSFVQCSYCISDQFMYSPYWRPSYGPALVVLVKSYFFKEDLKWHYMPLSFFISLVPATEDSRYVGRFEFDTIFLQYCYKVKIDGTLVS